MASMHGTSVSMGLDREGVNGYLIVWEERAIASGPKMQGHVPLRCSKASEWVKKSATHRIVFYHFQDHLILSIRCRCHQHHHHHH